MDSMSETPIPKIVELIGTLIVPKRGEDPEQLRRGIVSSGGVITGPRLNGHAPRAFVVGARDEEGRFITTAEVSIQTNDGAEILMIDRGEWRGSNDALLRLMANKLIAPSELYMVGVVKFETSDPRYHWLNDGQFLSHAVGEGDRIKVSIYSAARSAAL
jgi:hypothetical protein